MKTRDEAIAHIKKTWTDFVKDGVLYGYYETHFQQEYKRTPSKECIEKFKEHHWPLELDENGQETVPAGMRMAGGASKIHITETCAMEKARDILMEKAIEYEMKREEEST